LAVNALAPAIVWAPLDVSPLNARREAYRMRNRRICAAHSADCARLLGSMAWWCSCCRGSAPSASRRQRARSLSNLGLALGLDLAAAFAQAPAAKKRLRQKKRLRREKRQTSAGR